LLSKVALICAQTVNLLEDKDKGPKRSAPVPNRL